MKHFLEISQLNAQQIHNLCERALTFKYSQSYPSYADHTMATLFFENSTRTRVSFELAAKKLSLTVINLDLPNSSHSKGEEIGDTLLTLGAMGIDLFVLRHRQEGLGRQLAEQFSGESFHLINAGEGQRAHPSQALLDLLTIREQKPNLKDLKIAIVGDVRHSRVANSFQYLCSIMGVGELVFIAPPIWQPEQLHFGQVTSSLREGLAGADVIMCLRVQRERLLENEHFDLASYRQQFAINKDSCRFAKPDAMIMHPGPINRGVEIDSEVADGMQSFILQQVNNGVYMRMAILEALINDASYA